MSGSGACRDDLDTWMDDLPVTEHDDEPPAPRAGERNTQSQLFPRYSFAIVTGRYKILDNRAGSKFPQIATADGEDEARTIVHALNAAEQHTALVAQRERLVSTLKQAREFICVQTWPPNKPRTADTQRAREAEGLVARIDAVLATIEQEGEAR